MTAFLTTKYRSLLIWAASLVLLPVAFQAIGLTLDAATVVVILAMAAMGLNLLVGYTGLVSFGHAAWFGIGGYAAALSQLHWFKGQMLLPFAFAILFTAALSLIVGLLILRRRGVYFSLLTLALCALTFATAFRWTSLTGGEGGLGGIERGTLGPLNLDDHLTYYALVAVVALGVVYALQRVVRSPFGHVLGGHPREPAACHLPGLRHRQVQAAGLRAVGHGDRPGWCADGIPAPFGGRRVDRRALLG